MKKIPFREIFINDGNNGEGKTKIIVRTMCNVYLTFMTILSLVIISNSETIATQTAMSLYGLAAVILIVRISVSNKMVLFGPAYIIMMYTIVSNFGYDILVMAFPDVMYPMISSIRHAYTEFFNQANALYYLGTISFVFGFELIKVNHPAAKAEIKKLCDSFSPGEKSLYMKLSLAFIYIYVVYLVFEVITGRLPLTNYLAVKDYMSTNTALMYMLRITWISMPTYMFFAEHTMKDLSPFIPVVGGMFVILMFTGNRNEILYPLAMTMGVFIWKRRYLEGKGVPQYFIPASLFLVFVLNPMISNSRKVGFNTLLSGSYGFVESLMEMGQQLNPFSIILSALERGQYSFQNGMTIIVPCVSVLSLNLLYGTKMYQSSEYNPTYVLHQLGHKGRGFSYIAEMYINFGLIGTVISFFLFGMYSGRVESGKCGKNVLLFYFQISTLFMLWVRNTLSLNIVIVVFAVLFQLFVRDFSEIKNNRKLNRFYRKLKVIMGWR